MKAVTLYNKGMYLVNGIPAETAALPAEEARRVVESLRRQLEQLRGRK